MRHPSRYASLSILALALVRCSDPMVIDPLDASSDRNTMSLDGPRIDGNPPLQPTS